MNNHNTFVFDVDGTICTLKQKWENYANCNPIPKMIQLIRLLKEAGHTIVLYTARGMETYNNDVFHINLVHRPILETWLAKNNVPYDRLIFGKPSGDFYIDDKGLNINDIFNTEPFKSIMENNNDNKRDD